MKFVAALSEAEHETLREALRYGPSARVRQRAQAVYLSSRGYRLEQVLTKLPMAVEAGSALALAVATPPFATL
jgi:hypothetical protein